MSLSYTLLSDGASDRVLLPILDWLLNIHARPTFRGQWADFRRLIHAPRGLAERIERCAELYPCDLLFVHRDAERAPHARRVAEIRSALGAGRSAVCVVPIRMQEAWLLFDEESIREASGRSGGTEPLELPNVRRLEAVPNAKRLLHDALLRASGLRGRRRRDFPVRERVYRLATILTDFAVLRGLSAFRALEEELKAVLEGNGWQR